jgi:hypothetical protein
MCCATLTGFSGYNEVDFFCGIPTALCLNLADALYLKTGSWRALSEKLTAGNGWREYWETRKSKFFFFCTWPLLPLQRFKLLGL